MARYELPTPNGIASPISSHTRLTGPGPVILGIRTAPWSTASFGISTRGHRGGCSRSGWPLANRL